MTSVSKNTVFSFLSVLYTSMVGLVLSILFARFLGPQLFGEYTLVMWTTSITILFVTLGLGNAATKYVSELDGRSDGPSISFAISYLTRIELLLGLVGTIVLAGSAPWLAKIYSNPHLTLYLRIAAVMILPTTLGSVLLSSIEGFRRYEYLAFINLIVWSTSLTLSLIVIYAGYRVAGLLWVAGGVAILNFLSAAAFLWKQSKLSLFLPARKSLRSRIKEYASRLSAVTVLDAIIWKRSEVFFLGVFTGSQAVAFYSLGFAMVQNAMSLIPGPLARVIFPTISSLHGADGREDIKILFYSSSRYLAILTIPICVGGFMIARPFITILYGPAYDLAATVLKVTILPAGLVAIANVGSSVVFGTERHRLGLRLNVILAVMNIVLALLLIPKMGLLGAASANAISQTIGAVAFVILASLLLRSRYPLRSMLSAFLSSALFVPLVLGILTLFPSIGGLIAAVLISIPTYVIGLFVFREVKKADLLILARLGGRLPKTIGRRYLALINMMEGYVT